MKGTSLFNMLDLYSLDLTEGLELGPESLCTLSQMSTHDLTQLA